ncbi:hypothetical protein ACIHCQ_11135 [Streptomyces sp. NPDC052236]|uniref:hypothetical protein n=1 Tax=Streptomyces sp. NPDC052236 TaxID=3365686 RepID=UPI0037CE36BA
MSRGEIPYVPAVGETARDSITGRVGRVMGHEGPYYQLRPLNGGKEWDAKAEHLVPVSLSDALRPAVAEVNSRTKWGDARWA